MSFEPILNNRVSNWQRACLFGLITAFVATGLLRLNDCDLFNPDSPRYVIYSQAIVNFGEYRATDVPGSPVYTWRPPGLSLLIAPMMAIRPYDVVAAKLVVLLMASALIWAMFQLTSLHAGGWSALVTTAALTTGPTFLVLSTEVLSEIPYTFAVLSVVLILSRSTFPPVERTDQLLEPHQNRADWVSLISMVVAMAAMAFTPWLRTAGVALVLAVGIWSLTSWRRLKWLSVTAAGMIGLCLLAWRNHAAGGENYVGSLFSRLRGQGLIPVFISGFETVSYYVTMLPGLLMPGLSVERTWYAPLTLDGLPKLGLPSSVTALLTALLVLLALLGMYRRHNHGGSLAFFYVVIYGGCLIVWPWRHERFLWPLFPIFWAFVPAGYTALVSSRLANRASLIGALPMLCFCAWQAIGCEQLIRVNQEFVGHRDEFHATQTPGFYFSDWRRAGTWLNQNTPAYSRVLTWHAAVAETSHRFQKRVQFETLSPEKLRQQVESFSARYLVIPDVMFGDGFGWQQLDADPAIRLKIVYREHDVAVLEVEPNRTGEISKTAYPEWIDQQIQLVEEASRRLPARTDLVIRHASLLHEAGHTDEAVQSLRDVLSHGTKTVRVCADLGWMLFDTGQYDDAATFLNQARLLPNAESIASHLSEGVAKSLERLREKTSPNFKVSIERELGRVKSLMGSLKYAAAERDANRIVKLAPENPEVLTIRGVLHHRIGEIPLAIDCYERAIKLGSREPEPWLLLIRMNDAIHADQATLIEAGTRHETIDPMNAESHLRLAALFRDRGWPGRALATLENANQRFPDRVIIQKSLAELYCQFARPDLAKPLFESVLAHDPIDEAADKGLKSAKKALIEPLMDAEQFRTALGENHLD